MEGANVAAYMGVHIVVRRGLEGAGRHNVPRVGGLSRTEDLEVRLLENSLQYGMGDELGTDRRALRQRFGRVVQHVAAGVEYVRHRRVVCPVPIWDGELSVAGELLANELEPE